jgi:AAA+ superfamily predicted ATPase
MKNRITHYIKAGYPGLNVVSHEEVRVENIIQDIVKGLNAKAGPHDQFTLKAWSVTTGVIEITNNGNTVKDTQEPMSMLEHFMDSEERTIMLLRDFHLFTEDRNPLVWRKLKDALQQGKSRNQVLIIVGCRLALPVELEKEITVVDFALPDREQIRAVLNGLIDSNGKKNALDDEIGVLNAAMGLTTNEAENAFALSIVETGKVSRAVVYREKCQAVRKSGLLEIVDSHVTLEDVGGLAALKVWLNERRHGFSDRARDYNLPKPRGVLFVGQPGTGKSLTAKACRAVFDVPLLKLDAAKLFGSLVGQSEGNWRLAHATAKAMAPCVLWIDEADGAFSGSSSSGQTDGGTTSRVIKSILQDMEENSEGIYYVLTANDVDNLPAPLLGRMDEVWNIELPNAAEREMIWGLQLKAVRRDPALFDLKLLSAKSDQFSGREIRKLVTATLYVSFDAEREPVTQDFVNVLSAFTPLSKTMADDMTKRRKRLEGVAKLASGPVPVKAAPQPLRKIVPTAKAA